MGAGDVLVSYLSVIINICGVLILAFAAFLERFQSRKKLTIVLTFFSRLAALVIVLILALVPAGMRLAVFVPMVVTAFTQQAQTTVVLNQWMMEFIDERRSGRYISLRQTLTLIVTVILSVAGGYWMDLMEGRYEGFIFLFAAAALMGAVEIILLIRTPDSKAYHSSVEKCSLRELMKADAIFICWDTALTIPAGNLIRLSRISFSRKKRQQNKKYRCFEWLPVYR